MTGQVPVLGRAARLDRALADLLAQAPELEAAAVVSFDGLAMASALPRGMDEDRVAAMSAALLSLGEKAAQGLGRGDLSQVYVEGESGTVFLVSAADEAVLVAVAAAGAKAGLMLFEVRRSAAVIGGILAAEAPAEADMRSDAQKAEEDAALADAEAAYAAYRAAQQAQQPVQPLAAPAPVLPSVPASPLLMPTEALPAPAPVPAPAPAASWDPYETAPVSAPAVSSWS